MKLWMILVSIILAIALVAGAGYVGMRSNKGEAQRALQIPSTVAVTRGDVQQTVTAPGQVVGTNEVWLGTDVSGLLTDLKVRTGDMVHAGDTLATLDQQPLIDALETAKSKCDQAVSDNANQLAKAQLDLQIAQSQLSQMQDRLPSTTASEIALASAQADLDKALKGPDPDKLIKAQADLGNAEAALKQAQAAYDKVSWRSDIQALPQAADLEKATNNYNAAKASYDALTTEANAAIAAAQAKVQQAQAALDKDRREQTASQEGIVAQQATVDKARLTVERLQAGIDPALTQAVDNAEANLKAATLTAPFDGTVLQIRAKVGDIVGGRGTGGQGFILLADPSAVEVRATVVEEDLPLVHVGQAVDVFFDASTESTQGRVARIVPQRDTSDTRPVYPIYVTLDSVPKGIYAGMTADASVIIAQQQNVLRLPRSLVRAGSTGVAQVDVWANGEVEKRTVQVGLKGDVYVEIVQGLAEKEQVVGQWQPKSTSTQQNQTGQTPTGSGSSKPQG